LSSQLTLPKDPSIGPLSIKRKPIFKTDEDDEAEEDDELDIEDKKHQARVQLFIERNAMLLHCISNQASPVDVWNGSIDLIDFVNSAQADLKRSDGLGVPVEFYLPNRKETVGLVRKAHKVDPEEIVDNVLMAVLAKLSILKPRKFKGLLNRYSCQRFWRFLFGNVERKTNETRCQNVRLWTWLFV
jgi:hypothetical protein